MANEVDENTFGNLTSVSARRLEGYEGEVVRVTAEFDVAVTPVFGDNYGFALEEAVTWLRRTLESAQPGVLAAAEFDEKRNRDQEESLNSQISELKAQLSGQRS